MSKSRPVSLAKHCQVVNRTITEHPAMSDIPGQEVGTAVPRNFNLTCCHGLG